MLRTLKVLTLFSDPFGMN